MELNEGIVQNADAAMIHGIDDLPSAVSTADIRDALRAIAARKMLPTRKSIVGSVAFFMMNTLYYVSTYYASKMTSMPRGLMPQKCSMSSLAYFMDTSGTQQ